MSTHVRSSMNTTADAATAATDVVVFDVATSGCS